MTVDTTCDLDIVVVTHNSSTLLPAFVRSVRQAHWPEATTVRITVVDNDSTDGTVELARSLADQVLATGANPGFGAAVNLGVAATTATHLMVANVDVRLLAGGWEHALQRLRDAADVVAPAVVDAHLANPGPFAHMRAATLIRTHFARKEMRAAALDFEGDPSLGHARIDGWPCGACFLIRRRAFDAVGGYDPRYFLYMEETDLFWRLSQAGHRLEWVPEAAVLHVGGGDVRRCDQTTLFDGTMLLGKVRFFVKNRGRVEAAVARGVLGADCARHAAVNWLRGTLGQDPAALDRAATWLTMAEAAFRYRLDQNTAHLWRTDREAPVASGPERVLVTDAGS